MPELPRVEDVERERRSVAMLTPGSWALKREPALDLLGALVEALVEVNRLSSRPGG